MSRVAVVTGSNQGIGLAIVRAFCKEFDGVTYLTARNTEAGHKAVEELKKENCNAHFHQLDINDKKSVAELKSYLQSKYGGIDILVNNAGILFKNDATEPFGVQAELTTQTNYWSTLHVCDELFPLLRSHARVVNVASRIGSSIISKCSEDRRKQLLDCTTIEQVNSQIKEFVEQAKAGTHEQHGWPSSEQHGWPNSAYGVSKAGLILATRIQQANIDKDPSRQDIVINAICPGYVSTNMSSYKGHLTPDQGAITAVYAALLPANITSPRGEFLANKQVLSLTAPLAIV